MAYPSATHQARRLDGTGGSADTPTLAADVDARPLRPPRQRGLSVLIWIALAIAAVGALAYYLWQQNQAREALVPTPSAPAPAVPPKAETPAAIEHPIEEARGTVPPAVEQKPLPALMVSDATMQNTLADLFGQATLGEVFYDDGIVHRFVTTVDNLPRKTLPLRTMPVKPLPGTFEVAGGDNAMTIGPDNASRYAPYVAIVDAVDAKTLVGIYVHFYPLLQEDYRELGYPKGYFNDRLVQTIDDLLAAPDAPASLALSRPKVFYEYADPDLESRSAGQKIMMRMGGENEAKVKTKLRDIRAELVGPKGKTLAK